MTDDQRDGGEIILQLGLKKGRNADAVAAAESLLAWVDLARDAARAIDPYADVRVELIGREHGSLKQVLKLVDDHLASISHGADAFPYLKKTAIGLAVSIATSGLSTFVQQTLESPVQEVALSPADRAMLGKMTEAIHADAQASRSAMRFYRALDRDPAITNVQIKDQQGRHVIVQVDGAQFALRGGLYSPDIAPPPEEFRREVWSVVLMHAPFYATSRHWAFSRDGVRFTAKMTDLAFLQAIVDRTLQIGLHEGVRMEVEVEWRERWEGKVWQYIPDSRRIVRVRSAGIAGPVPAPNDPEENQEADKKAK